MRIAELTASAARFAAEHAAVVKARRGVPADFLLARRLLVTAQLNVVCGRKPFSAWSRPEHMRPALPKSRIGAKRQRSVKRFGQRLVQPVARIEHVTAPAVSAEIIVLRPERSHFADFETRLARARGSA